MSGCYNKAIEHSVDVVSLIDWSTMSDVLDGNDQRGAPEARVLRSEHLAEEGDESRTNGLEVK